MLVECHGLVFIITDVKKCFVFLGDRLILLIYMIFCFQWDNLEKLQCINWSFLNLEVCAILACYLF